MAHQHQCRVAVLAASVLGLSLSVSLPAYAEGNDAPLCEKPSGSNVNCIYMDLSKDAKLDKFKYYTGEVRGGLPNGSGLLVYEDDSRYQGTVRNGIPDGQGVFLFKNSDRYEGDMKMGRPHGKGTFTFANGDRYSGDVKIGVPHGQGILTYNGNTYTGSFFFGQAKGNGSLAFKNGIRCQGIYYSNLLSGQGTCSFPPGFAYISYSGEFRNGFPHGRGTLVYADGRQFSGEIREGRPFRP